MFYCSRGINVKKKSVKYLLHHHNLQHICHREMHTRDNIKNQENIFISHLITKNNILKIHISTIMKKLILITFLSDSNYSKNYSENFKSVHQPCSVLVCRERGCSHCNSFNCFKHHHLLHVLEAWRPSTDKNT